MPSDTGAAKSPLLAAVGISIVIGCAAVLGSTDLATIEDAVTGKWLTRPYAEAQQDHTVAIAALEQGLGGVTREIDFVAARAGATLRRDESEARARFAQIDAEIAALKDKLLGLELTQLISTRAEAPPAPLAGEAPGLRSSLAELTSAHHSSVTAITRRLDRIEVKVGLTTDTTPAVAAPARKSVRRLVRAKRPRVAPPAADTLVSDPFDRGHLLNTKPVSRPGGPLRLTRLPN